MGPRAPGKKKLFILFLLLLFVFAAPPLADSLWPFTYEESLSVYGREIVFPTYLIAHLHEKQKLDYLILGSSLAGRDLDGSILEQAFARARGRPAQGEIAVFNCGCLGDYYEYFSRLIATRPVDLLFLQTDRNSGDFNSLFVYQNPRDLAQWRSLPLGFQARLLSLYVLTGPRRLLARARRFLNLRSDDMEYRHRDLALMRAHGGGILRELSYPDSAKKFKAREEPVRAFGGPQEILSDGAGAAHFRVYRKFDPLEKEYYLKILKLAREHGTKVYGLALPGRGAEERSDILESLPTANLPPEAQIPTIGVSEQRLLEKVDAKEADNIFYDDFHLNANGSRMLSRLLGPLLPQLK